VIGIQIDVNKPVPASTQYFCLYKLQLQQSK
jgi:hypothetical protein